MLLVHFLFILTLERGAIYKEGNEKSLSSFPRTIITMHSIQILKKEAMESYDCSKFLREGNWIVEHIISGLQNFLLKTYCIMLLAWVSQLRLIAIKCRPTRIINVWKVAYSSVEQHLHHFGYVVLMCGFHVSRK